MKFLPILLFLVSITQIQAADVLEQAGKLTAAKKNDEALKLLQTHIQSNPEDVDAHEMIQRILKKQGKKAEALAQYKQRYEKNSTAMNAYLYARLIDQPSEQEKIYRAVVTSDPESVWGHFGLATALLDQDRLQDGIDASKSALKVAKETERIHYVMARIYRRMKDYTNSAAEARETYKIKPSDDNREFAMVYEWIEVANTDELDAKFKLATEWLKKYKQDAFRADSLDDIARLPQIGFLYAEKNQDPKVIIELVNAAEKSLLQQKPEDSEEQLYYDRMKGSLAALRAWADAREHKDSSALKHVGEAMHNSAGSEPYYFSALSLQLLGKNEDALAAALKAASYPPIYPRATELASTLWKSVHSGTEGFDAALSKQREEFTPQRKKLVLSGIVNETFKPFRVTDPKGKEMTEKDLAGKIVLMNFWAVWCPPCREELPHWNEFYAKHSDNPDLLLLAVGDEPWETMQNYLQNQKLLFPIYRNEEYWNQFEIAGIPTLVVIDPTGKIRFRNVGFEEGMDYAQTLEWQIEAIRNSIAPAR